MSRYADDYLDALPNGLDSHPQCMLKASILQDFATDVDVALADNLPPTLAALIRNPQPASAFVSEVHVNVILGVLLDTSLGGRVAALVAHAHARNTALFSRPFYRAMFFVSSPERVLRRASDRWATMRRGSALEVVEHTATSAVLRITFPKNLLPPYIATVRAATFEDVVTCAGARDARVVLEDLGAEAATFRGTWKF